MMVGCAPGPAPAPTESMAAFALTSADVAVPKDQVFDVTLPFLADPADPIWTDLVTVGIPGGGYFVGPGTFTVVVGDTHDDLQVGSITLSLDFSALPLSFDTLDVQFEGDDEYRSVPVGAWKLHQGEGNPKVPEVGRTGIGGAIPCGLTSGTFRNDSGESITSSSVKVDAKGLEVTSSIDPPTVLPEEQFELTLDLSCETAADFYIVSPEVTFGTQGEPVSSRLGWISVGFTNLDDEALERIAQR